MINNLMASMPQTLPVMNAPFGNPNMSIQNPIQVPGQQMGGMLGGMQGGMGQFGSAFNTAQTAYSLYDLVFNGKSYATNSSEARQQSISDTMSGMQKGMLIGSQFGPQGAAIGAAVGTAAGAIGHDARIQKTGGFTEYNQGYQATGLKRMFGGSGKGKIEEDRRRIDANRQMITNRQDLRSDYYGQYYAEGGMVLPNQLVNVDDGELIMRPNGDLTQVPELGQGTDKNVVDLPEGTKILSDKLKMKGSKKTYAEAGKKLMNKRQIKGSGVFAEDSKDATELANKIAFKRLYDAQEQQKELTEMKNMNKNYAIGGNVGSALSQSGNFLLNGGMNTITQLLPILLNMSAGDGEAVTPLYNPYENTYLNTLRKSRYNILQPLQSIDDTYAMNMYNARNMNPNAGFGIQAGIQSSINRDRARSQVYAQKYAADQQSNLQYANALQRAGAERVSADRAAMQEEAANRAAARNIRRTGYTQLSNYAQNQELMRNQRMRDKALLPGLMRSMEGYTAEEKDVINRYLKQMTA